MARKKYQRSDIVFSVKTFQPALMNVLLESQFLISGGKANLFESTANMSDLAAVPTGHAHCGQEEEQEHRDRILARD